MARFYCTRVLWKRSMFGSWRRRIFSMFYHDFKIRICDKITKKHHKDLIIFLCNSQETLMKYHISVIIHFYSRMSQIHMSHQYMWDITWFLMTFLCVFCDDVLCALVLHIPLSCCSPQHMSFRYGYLTIQSTLNSHIVLVSSRTLLISVNTFILIHSANHSIG